MKEYYWKCRKCDVSTPGSVHELCDSCYAQETRAKQEEEMVDHPKHYNQIKGVECIDVAEQMGFNLGNALKYIWRCGDKGNKKKDLEKAIWYIKREIERDAKNEWLEKKTDS
jgi:hypothetical protein